MTAQNEATDDFMSRWNKNIDSLKKLQLEMTVDCENYQFLEHKHRQLQQDYQFLEHKYSKLQQNLNNNNNEEIDNIYNRYNTNPTNHTNINEEKKDELNNIHEENLRLKICNQFLDCMLDTIQTLHERCNGSETRLRESNEIINILQTKIHELDEKIEIFNGTSIKFDNQNLKLKQLNEFWKELMTGMERISHSRERLLHLQSKCILCQQNDKNMIFIDGCNHFVLCMKCESDLDSKQCPLCATSYKNARKIQFC